MYSSVVDDDDGAAAPVQFHAPRSTWAARIAALVAALALAVYAHMAITSLEHRLAALDTRTNRSLVRLDERGRHIDARLRALEAHWLVWHRACALETRFFSRCTNMTGKRLHMLGERHSGTNAFVELIEENFGMNKRPHYDIMHKHMWMTNSTADQAWMLEQLRKTVHDPLPVAIMVREPLQWLLSMSRQPHHSEWLRGLGVDAFVRASPWRSWKAPEWRGRCAEHDMSNVHERVRRCAVDAFRDVLELRAVKLRLLRDAFGIARVSDGDGNTERPRAPEGGPLVVRFEDLAHDGTETACRIARELGICPRTARIAPLTARVVPGHRTTAVMDASRISESGCTVRRHFAPETLELIESALDWEVEALFGYSPPSACGPLLNQ